MSGAEPTSSPDWQADEVHRARAFDVEAVLAERLVDHYDQDVTVLPVRVCPPVRAGVSPAAEPFAVGAESLDVYGDRVDELYDDVTGEPRVLVDEAGRRYRVEVEVRVSPLPPVAVEIARHDRAVARVQAMHDRLVADIGTTLSTGRVDGMTDGRGNG